MTHEVLNAQVDHRRGLNLMYPYTSDTLVARTLARIPMIHILFMETLRDHRGHDVVQTPTGILIDGIPIPIQIGAADLSGRWAPTDRTRIQVGSLAHVHIWWNTEPADGWDYEALADHVEMFMRLLQPPDDDQNPDGSAPCPQAGCGGMMELQRGIRVCPRCEHEETL